MSTPRQLSDQACLACKFQSASVPQTASWLTTPECFQWFLDIHWLFGVGNVTKLLKSVPPEDRDATIKTLIYEAEMRRKDPVLGCCSVIRDLLQQIESTEELKGVQQQILLHKNLELSAQMATSLP